MTTRNNTKALVIFFLLWSAAAYMANAFNHSRNGWYLVASGALAIAAVLPLVILTRQEPYIIARTLFSVALVCSLQLSASTKDPVLRHGALIAVTIAGIGSVIAYEMKLRAERKTGGEP
jgi:hypothetical protein